MKSKKAKLIKMNKKQIIEKLEYIRNHACLVNETGVEAEYYEWIDKIIEELKSGE